MSGLYSTFTAQGAAAGCLAASLPTAIELAATVTGSLSAERPVTAGWVGLVGLWQQPTGFRCCITPRAYGWGVS